MSTAFESQLTWTVAACRKLLRPVVRLAMAMGAKHGELEEALRECMVNEGLSILRQRGIGRANVSQLSVMTGLHRKDVVGRVRPGTTTDVKSDTVLARVVALWSGHAQENRALARIPALAGPANGLSFEAVAARTTRKDVHYRSLLDDMERLGILRRDGEMVELTLDGLRWNAASEPCANLAVESAVQHLHGVVESLISKNCVHAEHSWTVEHIPAEAASRIQQDIQKTLERAIQRELTALTTLSLTERPTRASTGSLVSIRLGAFSTRQPEAG